MNELSYREGRIVAVCVGATKEFPKMPQEFVKVWEHGILGDAHSGELKPKYKHPEILIPNDRAVSIVAEEVRNELNDALGLNIQSGGFNENILIDGLGDLSDFKGGERIVFSSGVILKVTEQNYACKKLAKFHGNNNLIAATVKKEDGNLVNKRGLIATVVKTGQLKPGDKVWLDFQYDLD